MLGSVNIGRAQIAHQELLPAENEKRQETVTSVVTTEIAAHLLPMHRIVSRVEIENQPLRWLPVRANELLNQFFMHGHGPGPISVEFEPAQCGLTGQFSIAIDGRLKCQVMPQCLVIIEVFVTQRQSVNALSDHGLCLVPAMGGAARIRNLAGDRAGKPQLPVELSEQQHTGIGRDVATVEIGLDFTTFTTWK
ncbi:hypothetical protein A8C75_09090 [Marinobacterium aestuarii]|uniref:Uncharacterized protein n=1 Tax=Marinobacterium aestuarii TaxID=1821621 RepID=A0A1A9EXT0_9GAMM|nr:hypothetical protein A8C75_09090 [Marinobacterium aestuarii]